MIFEQVLFSLLQITNVYYLSYTFLILFFKCAGPLNKAHLVSRNSILVFGLES